jgi:hypothetical protein
VDPLEIEYTSGWLGCPTPLETCRHQLRMLENEVEELTLQLRQARQNIFKLVEITQKPSGSGMTRWGIYGKDPENRRPCASSCMTWTSRRDFISVSMSDYAGYWMA